jgi:hypothetical protein
LERLDDGLFAVVLGEKGSNLVDGVFLFDGDLFEHQNFDKKLNEVIFG